MEKTGISVKETESGLQLNLDGSMFKKIAQEWAEGKFKPFYSHLKNFVKELKKITRFCFGLLLKLIYQL